MKLKKLFKGISSLFLAVFIASLLTFCKNEETVQNEEPAVTQIEKLAENPKKTSDLPFKEWLYAYIPSQYPDAKMTDHGGWLQGKVNEELTASWAQWNEAGITLKDMEAHSLEKGENIFIEKTDKTDWVNNPAVTYYEGVGYLVSGYDPESMSSWGAEKCNVIQFDGDPTEFVSQMVEEWVEQKM